MNKLIELKNLTKNLMTSRFSAESIWTSMRTSFSPFWDQVAVERPQPFVLLQASRSQAAAKYCLTELRFPSCLPIRER